MIFIFGIAIIILRYGRPAPQNRGQAVSASEMHNTFSLQELLQQEQSFAVYYSGEPVLPSALLFIPGKSSMNWKLTSGSKGWKPVKDHEQLTDLFQRIRREDFERRFQLWVLEPPPSLAHLQPDHTYLYASQGLHPQRVLNSQDAVSVHPIPEYNSSLYGGR
jgi:hypothetical protein